MLQNKIKHHLNELTFFIRNSLKFSRELKSLPNEDKGQLFKTQILRQEAERLTEQYNLQDFKNNSTVQHYKETLYTIKLLEDNLSNAIIKKDSANYKILDIGSKNFSYALALQHYFKYFSNEKPAEKTVYLDGIEIDPYRIMADLHSRYDYAKYYTKNLANTRYITGDFLKFTDSNYDFITWFLPFITKEPLLRWGLPLNLLKPKEMLEHACSKLHANGIMVIVNQFETEKNFQLQIIRELGVKYTEVNNLYDNEFSPFQSKRAVTIIFR